MGPSMADLYKVSPEQTTLWDLQEIALMHGTMAWFLRASTYIFGNGLIVVSI